MFCVVCFFCVVFSFSNVCFWFVLCHVFSSVYRREWHCIACTCADVPLRICSVNCLLCVSRLYIGCDTCCRWFHGSCVGVSAKDIELMTAYICPQCIAHSTLSNQPPASSSSPLAANSTCWVKSANLLKHLEVYLLRYSITVTTSVYFSDNFVSSVIQVTVLMTNVKHASYNHTLTGLVQYYTSKDIIKAVCVCMYNSHV